MRLSIDESPLTGELALRAFEDSSKIADLPDDDTGFVYLDLTWDIDPDDLSKTATEDGSGYLLSLMAETDGQSPTAQPSANMLVSLTATQDGEEVPLNDMYATFTNVDIDTVGSANWPLADSPAAYDELTAQVTIYSITGANNTQGTLLISGLGAGEKSDFEPYGFMSGTSMAAPHVAGTVAELASRYPDETPLELRGRIVGSTEQINLTGDRDIATDGRLSLETTLGDEEGISANTWSATADAQAETITLYGRGLADASVSVDGTAATVTDQADDYVTARVSASVIDGAEHLVAVTDASTGRIQEAAYTLLDEDDAVALERIADLPGSSTDRVNNVLLGLPDRLLYLSNQGDYAYQLVDPAQANASWKQLPAAQTPWDAHDAPNSYRSDIVYAELAGTLYAFACVAETTDETMDYVFYVATLDLDEGAAWSAWQVAYREEILSPADTYLRAAAATTADGRVWFVASTHQYIMDDEGGTYGNAAHLISIDTEGNAQHSLHAAIGMDDVIMQLIGGKSLKAIGSAVSFDLPETTLDLLGYDEQSGTWDYQPLDGPDALTFTDVANLPGALAATTGTGTVYAGNRLGGLDDLFAIDADSVSAHSLGMLGAASSSGLVVSGVAMSGDALYLVYQQPDVEGAAGIYAVDPAVSSKLGAPDVALNAKAETGGIATVNDGLGAAASTDRVLVGDIATWSAAPQTGYAFDGWYDAEGTCVSTDATFSTKVTEAAELTARFRATGEQGSGTEQGGGADDPSGTESTPTQPTPGATGNRPAQKPTAGAAASSKPMPTTGDTALVLVGVVAALGAVIVAAGILLRRRGRRG